MRGGKQSKKGDSATLWRVLFGARCIPGWLLQPGGFGPDPAGWRWRVSHSQGWVCCQRFCRRGESSETGVGVLVLACLAAHSACSSLQEPRAGSPAGLWSRGGAHGAVVGCRVAPTLGFSWRSPAISSGPQATLGPVCLGAASQGSRQLEPCLCLPSLLCWTHRPGGNRTSGAVTMLVTQVLCSCGRCVPSICRPAGSSWLWRQRSPSAP